MSARDGEEAVSNDVGEVRPCGCGGVSLTVGAVTLHLAAGEFRDLHGLVSASIGLVEEATQARVRHKGRRAMVTRTVH